MISVTLESIHWHSEFSYEIAARDSSFWDVFCVGASAELEEQPARKVTGEVYRFISELFSEMRAELHNNQEEDNKEESEGFKQAQRPSDAEMREVKRSATKEQVAFTKTYDLVGQSFHTVEIMCSGDVEVVVNNTPSSVKIRGDETSLSQVKLRVKDGKLLISYDGSSFSWRNKLRIVVSTKDLRALVSRATCSINVVGITGSRFNFRSYASGRVHLSGRTGYLEIKTAGSGMIDTTALEAAETKIKSSGSARIYTKAAVSLDVVLNGSGRVEYVGKPKKGVKQSVRGSGKVMRRSTN